MKSSYDKFPAIKVSVDDDCRAVAGWEAIGAELRARCGALGDRALPKCVICVDLYHGVWEDEVLDALIALGFPLKEATAALEKVDPKLPVEERVKMALRN